MPRSVPDAPGHFKDSPNNRMVRIDNIVRSVQWDIIPCILKSSDEDQSNDGGENMKGYTVSNGYMGLVDGGYMLFETEEEYYLYVTEED